MMERVAPSPCASPSIEGTCSRKVSFWPERCEVQTPGRLNTSNRKRGGASNLGRDGAAKSAGRTPGASCRTPKEAQTGTAKDLLRRVAPAPRSLFDEFEDETEDLCEAKASRIKCKRRVAMVGKDVLAVVPPLPTLSSAGSVVDYEKDPWFGTLLPPLPAVVSAQVASFLPFRETVRLASVVSGASAVLSLPQAWDPFTIDGEDCGRLFRKLHEKDPAVKMEPEEYPLPFASTLTQVKTLRIELMLPDRVKLPEDDDNDVDMTIKEIYGNLRSPSKELVMEPIEELCRRLRKGWFSCASVIELSNLESARVDYDFLSLRCRTLPSFPWLQMRSDGPMSYQLTAVRDPAQIGQLGLEHLPVPLSPESAIAESNARRNPEVVRIHPPCMQVSKEEAMFLYEHREAFKIGDKFHFVEAPWRSIDGAQVRNRYAKLLRDFGPAAGEVKSCV